MGQDLAKLVEQLKKLYAEAAIFQPQPKIGPFQPHGGSDGIEARSISGCESLSLIEVLPFNSSDPASLTDRLHPP